MRRIEHVQTDRPSVLFIDWSDGDHDRVDLSALIETREIFAPLRDPGMFRTVAVVTYGSGVEWACGADLSADSLEVMAEQQRPMTGNQFGNWISEMGLSVNEAADLFGVTPNTIKAWRRADSVPIAVQIACHAMRRDPDLFAARFRPRHSGRPRKEPAVA